MTGNTTRKSWGVLALCLALAALTGCPPQNGRGGGAVQAIPVPITLDEQLQRLNARAAAVPELKAHGDVTLQYRDPDGASHRHHAEGTLEFRQARSATGTALLTLSGRYVGQDVFELGVNEQVYWVLMEMDPKTAYFGRTSDLADANPSRVPIQPGRVLDMLALTPLVESPEQRITMAVSDDPPANVLKVYQVAGGQQRLTREITVDRRTGQITAQTLYTPAGQVLARATLSSFRPVTADGLFLYKTTDPRAATAPRVPLNISIEYPGSRAHIDLEFKDARTKLPADFDFEAPDAKDLRGFKIINVDQSPD